MKKSYTVKASSNNTNIKTYTKSATERTKTFEACILCQAYYYADVEIPSYINTFEEACKYVEDNLDNIPLGELNYVDYSDELDVENSCLIVTSVGE